MGNKLHFYLIPQAQEQLQVEVLRYKAKIEDLEKELTMKGQVSKHNYYYHLYNITDSRTIPVNLKRTGYSSNLVRFDCLSS